MLMVVVFVGEVMLVRMEFKMVIIKIIGGSNVFKIFVSKEMFDWLFLFMMMVGEVEGWVIVMKIWYVI